MADAELSHLPDDLTAINIYAVTTIQLEASQSLAFEASLTAFHEAAVAAGHPVRYVMLRPLYGGSGPAITFVALSPNFAGLEEIDPTIDAMMVEHFGAERAQEVLEGILGGIESWATVSSRAHLSFLSLSVAGP